MTPIKCLFALLTALSLSISSVQANIITFEDTPTSGLFAAPNGWLGAPSATLSSGGLNFTTNLYLYINKSPGNPYANNGTTFLQDAGGFTVTASNGGAFNLSQLDMGLSWWTNGTPQNITITGYKQDGSSVSNTFGLTAQFLTYTLTGFSNLSSVIFTNYSQYVAVDNINYSPTPLSNNSVPEPQAYLLLLSGLLGLKLTRRKTKHV